MKRVFIYCVLMIVMFSCKTKKPHPEYVTISGKIEKAKSKEISIYGLGGYKKAIPLKRDGTFNDTLMLKMDYDKFQFMLMEDTIMSSLQFKNGDDISIKADASNFKETVVFSLDNGDYNNYANKKALILSSKIGFNKIWYRLEKEAFENKITTLKNELHNVLDSYANIPEKEVKSEKAYIESYIKRLSDKHEEEHDLSTKLSKGTLSPDFKNYENYDGSKTSLSDFKGKYVYIDVWATWCGPCKAQIPHLEALEKKYQDQNIVFISMSVDKEKDYDKWRSMVKNKQMSGVQILAPNQTASEFTRAYGINAIPRFILIDPEGKIVDFDAPRPSNKEAITALLSIVE
ncbi:TlpA family protein disulfide reductase [Snuella sedimenti]|uniref:TlpA family protein disulfide reductase n=1 Tax=Snuella sedimenti TaxID=2798802 RepID=A0A8J7LPU1_9FLAO|nr:TlpA disulfide reductase family protein [Snuella sedimenti]MBJ6369519.1 TlpA family protein disulfide reductase [Snuella sedimenti]